MTFPRHQGSIAASSKTGRRNRTKGAAARRTVGAPLQFEWAKAIPDAEWKIYRLAIAAMRSSSVPFMLGGGLALATFTGRWRDTKDIDFYVQPEDRKAVVDALTSAGFEDYYSRLAYDRKWIYRSLRSGVIVDIIWAMANQRAQVDESWFERAGTVLIRGEELRVLPMEELAWCKLYVLQHDHCDWIDLVNLVHTNGRRLDWARLMRRLEDDTPLLQAMLTVYGWLAPAAARKLSAPLRRRLALRPPPSRARGRRYNRVRLLDTRAWFTGLVPRGQKLEI